MHINGTRFAEGYASARAGARFAIAVTAIALAVDGRGTPDRSNARLRVEGNRLVATRIGGCRGCQLRVVRAVLISSRLRDDGGTAVIPVDDLVTALEGRLTVDTARRQLDIHIGKCTWCILAPSSESTIPRD